MPLTPVPLPLPHALLAALAGACSYLLAAFSAFAQAAAPAVVTALWQGAVIALVLALCLRLAPRVSAAYRFAVWAAAFAVVAALPFLPVLAHSAAASIAPSAALRTTPVKPWLQLDSRWGFIVAALWLLGSALRAADLAFHSLRLRHLWKAATPVEIDPGLHSLLVAASRSRRSIQICTTGDLDRPSVIGFLAPRILIPGWLAQKLTPGELEHVVLHEAEHLRRRDDWTNLLQKLALVLFPLNPALVWIERRLCREREMACDEGVVRRTQSPRAYAACLTSLAERSLHRRAQALSLGAFQRRPELVRRVHSILWRKQALHPLAARASMVVVGCGLLLASVELARCPQMIAFVPHQPDPANELAAAQPDAASLATLRVSNALPRQTNFAAPANGVRMIETKAILPDRRRAATPPAVASRSSQLRPAAQIEIASREPGPGAPHQVLLVARTPSSTAPAPTRNLVPQFIVFAAWERVVTSPRSSSVADYDVGAVAASPNRAGPQNAAVPSQNAAAASQNPGAAGHAHVRPATHITVTQLILAIYPAGSAQAAKHAHAKASHSASPAAVPFDGGWLVFEL